MLQPEKENQNKDMPQASLSVNDSKMESLSKISSDQEGKPPSIVLREIPLNSSQKNIVSVSSQSRLKENKDSSNESSLNNDIMKETLSGKDSLENPAMGSEKGEHKLSAKKPHKGGNITSGKINKSK